MRAFFTRLVADQSGVTAIEYGLIAALIAALGRGRCRLRI